MNFDLANVIRPTLPTPPSSVARGLDVFPALQEPCFITPFRIRPQFLARKAILYVRESSPNQVLHNLASWKLQFAMEEPLHQLRWREIEVVDDDLGRSAAGLVTRAGFEGMVAEVCWGKVGAVAPARFVVSPAIARVAAVGGALPRGGHRSDRSRDGLRTQAQ